ncbi:NUDIX domain-containing protein [Balneolaceae bacterium YR4-1]|uniref:NUDIX domain-containing protein n=1 Tax=Halalkalibaculum roseum TaxID=2709311 RepID=A0A6M1SWC9_9BACT|nr:NUDIX domain-containing protein [Halalkalibaculum roseum]NGP77320.1 NUDIX domain-containing protein [Halalkalibaculum roseum]
MIEVTAAGGVLYRNSQKDSDPEILLMFRRGVWDLPKGKLEPGESVRDCARREVSEEIGSTVPEIEGQLCDTYHEYKEDDEEIGKTTHWYAMNLQNPDQQLEPEEREGIEKLEWVPAKLAMQRVGYENLVNVIEDFLRWYETEKLM